MRPPMGKARYFPDHRRLCPKGGISQADHQGLGRNRCLRTLYSPEYGGAGLDQISYGLIMQEIERGIVACALRLPCNLPWSCIRYMPMGPKSNVKNIYPNWPAGKMMGCFGLTEPDHGSNPGGMKTHYNDKGDHYLLNGAKLWISNPPLQISPWYGPRTKRAVYTVDCGKGFGRFFNP